MKRLILLFTLTLGFTSFSQIYRLSAYQTSGYNAETSELVLNTTTGYTVYLSTQYSDVAIENYYGEPIQLKIRQTEVKDGDPFFTCDDAYGNWYGVILGEGILTVADPSRNRITKIKYR